MDPFLQTELLMRLRRTSMLDGRFGEDDKDPYIIRLLCNKGSLLSIHHKMLRHTEASPQNNINVAVELTRGNQVTISSMINSVDQVLRGKFLLCRTIGPPVKTTALVTVVDDPEGELGIRVVLYNYLPSLANTLAQSNEILPVGTILAIKNPMLKQSNDGGVGLHVDNPTDVIVMDEQTLQKLNPDLKWLGKIPPHYAKFMKKPNMPNKSTYADNKSWEDWKKIGNGHFAAEEYAKAIEAYTSGLQMQPGNTFLLGNRALALLELKEFDLALSDAEEILKNSPTNMKGIARKARAFWGLKQYQAAKDFLAKKVQERELQNDKVLLELRKKAELFYQQATFGNYPQEIHSVWNKVEDYRIDWADYEGDVIVKDTADGRGRGLYATKDMAAGQLILASKAFVFVQGLTKSDSFPSNSKAGVSVMNYLNHGELISKVAGSLKNNPSRGNVVYKLYAGPEMQYLDSEKGDDCSVIDMKRIGTICKYNAFGDCCPITRRAKSSGIWILQSFINHSCINCNASWKLYGDFLFVRAFKDIKTGEEVTVSYMTPVDSYTERQVYFQKYGFQCKCQLCEYDRQESQAVAAEQVDILKKISAQPTEWGNGRVFFCNGSMAKVIPLVEQFMKIRPKYQLQLTEVIAQFPFYQNNAFSKALKYLKIQYEILKDTPMRNEVVDATTGIILFSLQLGKTKDAQHWASKLRNAAIAAHGNLDVICNGEWKHDPILEVMRTAE